MSSLPSAQESQYAHSDTRAGSSAGIYFPIAASVAFALVAAVSSIYCLLAYLPTTYYAFVQAPFQAWIPAFAKFQSYLFALTFAGTALPALPTLRNRQTRLLSLEFLMAGTAASLYLALFHPLQHLRNSSASYVLGIALLVPVICLGALEYRAWLPRAIRVQEKRRSFSFFRILAAATLISLINPAAAYVRFIVTAGNTASLSRPDWAALIWGVLMQSCLFLLVFSVIELTDRIIDHTKGGPQTRWIARTWLWCIGLAIVFDRVILAGIPFSGSDALIYAGTFSLACVSLVRGLILRFEWRRERPPAESPQPGSANQKLQTALIWLLLLALPVIVPAFIGMLDWNALLEKTWAVLYWALVAIPVICKVPAAKPRRTSVVVLMAVLSLAAFRIASYSAHKWPGSISGKSDFEAALRTETQLDASFAAATNLLSPAEARFCNAQCQFINQQTNIPQTASVNLHNIDLVPDLKPVSGPKPNIFIFVVDSLRQDYVSAYNSAVTFTPAIGAFAKDSAVFRNAFTRYSGTTLSEPSIWSGLLQLHKHYVQPYHLVNGLEKLTQVDGYQSFISDDTVLRVLLEKDGRTVNLDADTSKWIDLDLCSTVNELESRIGSGREHNGPIFFYTQSQNVHVVTLNTTSALRPPQKDYSPFVSYYASELERLDGCFGKFIDKLKSRGLYDNSIIILTADHGEDLRVMGPERHAFSLKPAVIRIPLIIHLPRRIQENWRYDPDMAAFNTDIAATLYELLGHGPVTRRSEFGRPLFAATFDELKAYAHDSYLIASSYGPLYGILTENGRELFTENELTGVEEYFHLQQDPDALHSALNDKIRRDRERQLRSKLQGIASLYGYEYKRPTLFDWLLH